MARALDAGCAESAIEARAEEFAVPMAGRPFERELVLALEAGREDTLCLEFPVSWRGRSCARQRDSGVTRRARAGRNNWLGSSVSEA